jgi:hypothetical protein
MQMRPFEGLKVDSARGGACVLPGGEQNKEGNTESKKEHTSAVPSINSTHSRPVVESFHGLCSNNQALSLPH